MHRLGMTPLGQTTDYYDGTLVALFELLAPTAPAGASQTTPPHEHP